MKSKIKKLISKLKEKKETVGDVRIKNITKPHKEKKKKIIENQKKKKTIREVGPRGGIYNLTASGKKQYKPKIKKSIQQYFITKFKGDKK